MKANAIMVGKSYAIIVRPVAIIIVLPHVCSIFFEINSPTQNTPTLHARFEAIEPKATKGKKRVSRSSDPAPKVFTGGSLRIFTITDHAIRCFGWDWIRLRRGPILEHMYGCCYVWHM